MKYDIFISYRRQGGKDVARMLKESLKGKGYKVFLDYDNLIDGHFDERIISAIDSAPIFMFILSEGCLDRCIMEDDWVRKEIEYALNHEKHIIPVNPNKAFSSIPSDIPNFIRIGIGQHQFSVLDMDQLYNESLNKIIRERVEPVLSALVDIKPKEKFASVADSAEYIETVVSSDIKKSKTDRLFQHQLVDKKEKRRSFSYYDFQLVEDYGKGFWFKGPEFIKYGYFTHAESFQKCGLARVEQQQQVFVIDTFGERVKLLDGVDYFNGDNSPCCPIMAIWKTDKRILYFTVDYTVIADVKCDPSLCTPYDISGFAFVNGNVINTRGDVIKKIPYEEIVKYDKRYFIRHQNNWIQVSPEGDMLSEWKEAEKLYVDWHRIDNDDLTIEFERITGEKRGPYIDFDWQTKEYVRPQYELNHGLPIRIFDKAKQKYSFINSVGELLFEVEYDMVSRFNITESGHVVAGVYRKRLTRFTRKEVIEKAFDIDEHGKALL